MLGNWGDDRGQSVAAHGKLLEMTNVHNNFAAVAEEKQEVLNIS